MSGSLDDMELVKLIQSYPVLYDKSTSRGTKNATRKDEAWKEISLKLNASERACITRWKSIRDRFGKELRRLQENPNEIMYWEMFQHLYFLKDHYKQGQAAHERLDCIKFEPKTVKRRSRTRWGDGEPKKSIEERDDELGPEEINFNQQLIALVKEYPVLYDRQKIRDSKNITAKNEAWRDICERLGGVPEEHIYKRWKKLRDRFSREYRRYRIHSSMQVNWIHFMELLFLEDHYRKGIPLDVKTIKRPGRPRKHYSTANSSSNLETVTDDDNPWGYEYPYSSEENIDDDDMGMVETIAESEDLQQFDETEDDERLRDVSSASSEYIKIGTHPNNDVILMPTHVTDQEIVISQQSDYKVISSNETHQVVESLDEDVGRSITIAEEESNIVNQLEERPTEKLTKVVSNIECILKQTQECLKSFQDEEHRRQMELHSTSSAVAAASAVASSSLGDNTAYKPKTSVLAKIHMLLDGLSSEQRFCAERRIVKFLCECQIKELSDIDIEDMESVDTF